MPPIDDLWTRQMIETIKEIARGYDRFCSSREIEEFDRAFTLHEELNKAYEISLDLTKFIEFGRALLVTQALPYSRNKDHE